MPGQTRRPPITGPIDTTESRELALAAGRAAADKKASDIDVLDIGELLSVTDFFVIASARNERQLGTVADEVEGQLRLRGRRPLRREGGKETGWMLLDYGDIVVHVFTDEQREFYALERLWADAPVERMEPPARAGAGGDSRSDSLP